MRAAKVLAVLAIAGLALGAFGAVAVAGKSPKEKVKVDFCDPALSSPDLPLFVCHGPNPTVDKSGLVIAQVELFQRDSTFKPCYQRSLRLQVVNRNGKVLTTLDRTWTKREQIWTMSGQLPTTMPAGTNYVRVKMMKRTVGGHICLGEFSPTVNPSNGEIVAPASIK
jgi:ribosomal protein S19